MYGISSDLGGSIDFFRACNGHHRLPVDTASQYHHDMSQICWIIQHRSLLLCGSSGNYRPLHQTLMKTSMRSCPECLSILAQIESPMDSQNYWLISLPKSLIIQGFQSFQWNLFIAKTLQPTFDNIRVESFRC